MAILNFKKIKELQTENDELKAFIQNFSEKDTYFKHIDELIKRARVAYANLTIKKDQTAFTIEHLEKDKTDLNKQIKKLSNEIEQLREMKVDEQNQLITLNNSFTKPIQSSRNKNANTGSGLKLPIHKEMEAAEKRKNEIERETIGLEKKFQEIYKRILELSDIEQKLDSEINKKKDGLNILIERQNEFSHEQLKNFNTRISSLKDEEKKNLLEIKQRIKQLSDREAELLDRINNRTKELEKLEERFEQKNLGVEQESEDKLLSLIVEEQKLSDSIDQKKESLVQLEQSILSLKEEREKIADELKNRLSLLKTEIVPLKYEISNMEIKSPENLISEQETNAIQGVIKALKEEERRIRESIEQLSQTEVFKNELVQESNNDLSAKEIQFASLRQDYETTSDRLKEVSIKNKHLLEELAFKTNELSTVEASLKTKITRLSEVSVELSVQETKLSNLKSKVIEQETRKAKIDDQINKEQNSWGKLEEHFKKLNEIVPMLEKRKEEIELSNGIFEKRFADMFKNYSTQMGEMYKKKNLLEQMLLKKEKDVNEKDQMLFEKLASLEETEKVLSIRQTEAGSIEDLIKTINEQRELLIDDLATLDDKNLEKRIKNKELNIESDLFQRKLVEFENSLRELFRRSEERFSRNTENRTKQENEIREYEARLNELNKGIKDSMNELRKSVV